MIDKESRHHDQTAAHMTNPTGRDISMYLRIHPQAPVYVQIGQALVPIQDIYYDNERGANIVVLKKKQAGSQ